MILIVEKFEAGKFERSLARSAVSVDEIVIILVIFFVLIKEGLSKESIDYAWEVALRFFGEGKNAVKLHTL